jgi:tetratricopeptide (TPR) repeat protein
MGGLFEKEQEKEDREQVKLAERYHDRGIDFCYVEHDFDKALIELRKAVLLRESILGKYHNDTALSYFRIASVLREEKKNYYEALIVARREFRISQLLMGSSDVSTITSTEDWLIERVQWIREVLKDSKALSEPQALKYTSQLLQAIEFERLGDQHFDAKEWELAITRYNCALALESSAYARNTLDMADLHVKVGDCLVQIKDYDAALEDFRNARVKYQGEFGKSHATTGNAFSKIALAYLKQHNFDAALASFAKAYSIYEEVFGKNHNISTETLQDIRLVTVKEMENLRQQECQRVRVAKSERKKRGEGKR